MKLLKNCFMQRIFLILVFLQLISCRSNQKKRSTDVLLDTKDTIWDSRVIQINKYKKSLDSINKSLDWKKTNFDLWKSKNGDLAIKTSEGTEQGILIDKYITELCCDGENIKNTIDTVSFKQLGSSFYKDKNHIYTHFVMADGGNFWIVENADSATFMILGNCYAKDKNFIFGERNMKMDKVDYKTFRSCEECGCFAKDKNGYYFWDEKINLDSIDKNETTDKIIVNLKKL